MKPAMDCGWGRAAVNKQNMGTPGGTERGAVIRILLAEVHGLLAAVVKEAIMTQSDMIIAREIQGSEHLSAALAEDGIDVVLTSLSGNLVPPAYQALLFGFPHVPLVAIKVDGQRAEIYARKVVREVAPEQLVEVIREVTKDRDMRGLGQSAD